MEYTNEHLQHVLGKKFDPKAEYVLETHRGAINKAITGKWAVVGKLPDSTDNDEGTMVIMQKVGV